MMSIDQSAKARDRHVDAYVHSLRKTLNASDTPTFDEKVIDTLAKMYRSGWDDADTMFRDWEMDQ
jgi:hypothetical protein